MGCARANQRDIKRKKKTLKSEESDEVFGFFSSAAIEARRDKTRRQTGRLDDINSIILDWERAGSWKLSPPGVITYRPAAATSNNNNNP